MNEIAKVLKRQLGGGLELQFSQSTVWCFNCQAIAPHLVTVNVCLIQPTMTQSKHRHPEEDDGMVDRISNPQPEDLKTICKISIAGSLISVYHGLSSII